MNLAWKKTHTMACGILIAAVEDRTRFPFDDDDLVSVTVWDESNPKPDGLDETSDFTGTDEGTYTKLIRFTETPDGIRQIAESHPYGGSPDGAITASYGPDTPFDHWLIADNYIDGLIAKANLSFRGEVYSARIVDLTAENPRWHGAQSRVGFPCRSADEAIEYGMDAIKEHYKPKIAYDMSDIWAEAWEASQELEKAADSGRDCLSTLCDLSNAGEWKTDESGQRYYCAPVSDEERKRLTPTGISPIESHRPGDFTIPTKVARAFGLGEINICANAGYTLQSRTDQTVYRMANASGERKLSPTTLDEILREDGAKDVDDVFWKTLEWKHIQIIFDSSGGQSERFKILAEVMSTLAGAKMDAGTFVPYGHRFADSDFL